MVESIVALDASTTNTSLQACASKNLSCNTDGQVGDASEANLRNSFQAGNKECKRGIHPGFETHGRHH